MGKGGWDEWDGRYAYFVEDWKSEGEGCDGCSEVFCCVCVCG